MTIALQEKPANASFLSDTEFVMLRQQNFGSSPSAFIQQALHGFIGFVHHPGKGIIVDGALKKNLGA